LLASCSRLSTPLSKAYRFASCGTPRAIYQICIEQAAAPRLSKERPPLWARLRTP
jgi:hypothetical protein